MEGINDNQNASYSDPVRQEPTIRPPMNSPESSGIRSGNGFPKWIIAVVGILLILGIGGFFIAQSLGNSSEDADPSPTGAGLSTFPTPDSTSTPEPTEEPDGDEEEVDKSEISIQVLNGTGTAGEASYLQGVLEDLGYEEVEAANADSQDETETTITFSSSVPDSVVDEITEELEDVYTEVTTNTGTVSGGFDIRILTGPRSGSATSSPRATSSASPSPSASPAN